MDIVVLCKIFHGDADAVGRGWMRFQIGLEALHAALAGGFDFNRNEYRLTDKEYEGIIENIAESIFYEEDEYLDWAGIVREHLQYALEDWDIDLDERRKAI